MTDLSTSKDTGDDTQTPSIQLLQLEVPHLPTDRTGSAGNDDIRIYACIFTEVRNAVALRQQLLDGNDAFQYAFIDAGMVISTRHVVAAIWRALNDAGQARMRSHNVHSEIVYSMAMNNNLSTAFRTFGLQPLTTSLIAIKILSSHPFSTSASPTSREQQPQQQQQNPDPDPTRSIAAHLISAIHGRPLPFSDASLAPLTDWARVRKAYKLSAPVTSPSSQGERSKGKGKEGRVAKARRREIDGESKAVEDGREMSLDGDGDGNGDENREVGEVERRELEAVVLGAMALRGW